MASTTGALFNIGDRVIATFRRPGYPVIKWLAIVSSIEGEGGLITTKALPDDGGWMWISNAHDLDASPEVLAMHVANVMDTQPSFWFT